MLPPTATQGPISACATHYNDWPAVKSFWESLSPQLPQDAEVVIVDAGSTDGSLEYLKQQAAQDPRLRVLVEPGSTRGAARDTAWRIAKGPVIFHFDADRSWRPGGWRELEALVPRVERESVQLTSEVGRHRFFGGLLTLRERLELVGGYDRTLQYFEDIDLMRRLETVAPLARLSFSGYTRDFKIRMRSPRSMGYYWHMFRDAARINNGLGYMVRPSIAKPWRYPLLVAGLLGYAQGRKMPKARSVQGTRPGTRTE